MPVYTLSLIFNWTVGLAILRVLGLLMHSGHWSGVRCRVRKYFLPCCVLPLLCRSSVPRCNPFCTFVSTICASGDNLKKKNVHPKCSGLGQTKDRNLESHSSLSHRRQASMWAILLRLPRHRYRELDPRRAARLKLALMGSWRQRQQLNTILLQYQCWVG